MCFLVGIDCFTLSFTNYIITFLFAGSSICFLVNFKDMEPNSKSMYSNLLISPKEWQDQLNEIADEADKIATYYFNQINVEVDFKLDNSPVTKADQEIERLIRTFFLEKFSDIGIVGEEFESVNLESRVKLIVDPIDGTSNFIRKIPIIGTLLAIEVDKEIVAAVISNGISNQRWTASKENGAYFNNSLMKVSTVSDIDDSQAFYGSLFGREARGDFDRLIRLLKYAKRQRGIGDFMIHMWVASGFGEFGIDFGLQPWDIAPVGLIVKESGGVVSAVNGDDFDIYEGSILTSNGYFHDQLVNIYNA